MTDIEGPATPQSAPTPRANQNPPAEAPAQPTSVYPPQNDPYASPPQSGYTQGGQTAHTTQHPFTQYNQYQPGYTQTQQYGQYQPPTYHQTSALPIGDLLTSDPAQPAPEEKKTAGRGGRSVIAAAAIAALLGGGIGGGIVAASERNNNGSVNTGLKITNATGAPAAQTDGTIGAAAAKIRPSVVTIDVTGNGQSGTGSGVIIRNDGYILTNDHVVSIGSGSGDIEVTLADGRTAPAKIVGRDSSDDLAVIKVDGLDNLTAATFAKSSQLTVGQAVVAVGAPLGLSDTVTAGIVSNTARPVRAGDQDQAVFQAVQTDAAINPGNSGGPLVDLNGSVVGINSAIASDTSGASDQAGNIGIGFAIPSDEASRIASELIASGKAYHAVLGISVGGKTTGSIVGVNVRDVSSSGGAATAGLKAGDVITALNDQKMRTADALIAAVRAHAPGEQVKITYTRDGKSSTVTVTLGKSDS